MILKRIFVWGCLILSHFITQKIRILKRNLRKIENNTETFQNFYEEKEDYSKQTNKRLLKM